MARPAAKARAPKHLVALAVVAILGLVLVADYLWASSSASSSAVWSSRLNLHTSPAGSTPPVAKKIKEDKKSVGSTDINATFADLAAPELKWEEMAQAPVARLDGAAIQIKNLLYVFAGYGTINHVHSHVDIYNFSDNTWGGRFDMPKDMAHSHLGMVTDGRFIYVVTGQYGPQCRGPTARNFVLDTETKEWRDLPPLPVPRACVVANDKLFIIGGQEGDFMAKPGSPIFKCVRRSEVVYSNVYMLDDGHTWKELPPMPKPDSHIEFAWVNVNNSLVIAGGTTDKHPITKKMVLVGEIFRFNLDTLEWSLIGQLPFRIKTTLVGYWDGWLYFTSGQRDKGPKDPSPKKVVGCMWRTKLHL
ncbi:unnamed protein product [Miscanthus lutarioriparius]|uniref:Kelch repeat-containing protein n=1 Tax=Miscanthus lutarioriparius TaxID=422564 RepID=A0A811QWM5_9POAL|nr:unnamed protein product [Miscanthus lutarioriparius]